MLASGSSRSFWREKFVEEVGDVLRDRLWQFDGVILWVISGLVDREMPFDKVQKSFLSAVRCIQSR